jgi:hypothetical protein
MPYDYIETFIWKIMFLWTAVLLQNKAVFFGFQSQTHKSPAGAMLWL